VAINFTPQFHRRLSLRNKDVWVALPYPKTLIPAKTIYYRNWQQEESLRLAQEGETVLVISDDDGAVADGDGQDLPAYLRPARREFSLKGNIDAA